MSTAALHDQVAAAEAYEKLFVNSLFRPWADRVVEVARLSSGDRVLDVACGTGILTRAALARVGGTGAVSAIDISPGMVAVAQRLAPQAEVREGAAESLPYPDAAFDAVVSQFGLMFFADPAQALREMRRVVKPGGQVTVAVWDELDHAPAYAAEVHLLRAMAGERAARELTAPFALGDRAAVDALFASAGFGDVSIHTSTEVADFPSVRVMVEADLRGWLPLRGAALDEPLIQRILSQAELALDEFTTASGRAVFPISAHIVAAR